MVNGEWERVRTGPPPSTPFTIHTCACAACAAVWSPSPLRGGDRGGGPRASIWLGFAPHSSARDRRYPHMGGGFSRMIARDPVRARERRVGAKGSHHARRPPPPPPPRKGEGDPTDSACSLSWRTSDLGH